MKPKMLLIAEKQQVMNEIKQVYNRHRIQIPYDITFTTIQGHIVHTPLPDEDKEKKHPWSFSELPIVPQGYLDWQFNSGTINPQKSPYVPTKTGRPFLQNIKKLLEQNHFDYVCNATDPDLEGEVLFADQASLWDLKDQRIPRKRYFEDDTSDEKVIAALNNLHDYTDAMENGITTYNSWLNSSVLRQQVNYIAGINMTRALTIKMNDMVRIGYSKGPILSLVTQRYLDYVNFKQADFWKVQANFTNSQGDYEGSLWNNQNHNLQSFKNEKDAQTIANQVLQAQTGTVQELTEKIKLLKAPKPYSGTALQSDVSKVISGKSNDDVLNIMEKLSQTEHHFISYPRTDSRVFNNSSAKNFQAMIKRCLEIPPLAKYAQIALDANRFQEISHDKTYFNSKKVSGHDALQFRINDNMEPINWDKRSKIEQVILELIGASLIKIALPPEKVKLQTITTQVGSYVFHSSASQVLEAGFHILDKHVPASDKPLPLVKKGDQVKVTSVKTPKGQTKPTPLFTNSSLLNFLGNVGNIDTDFKKVLKVNEFKGIGSPATRGTTIDEMLSNNTITITKKGSKFQTGKIIPTDKGLQIFQQTKHVNILQVGAAVNMELDLQKVQNQQMTAQEFQQKYIQEVEEQINYIKNSDIQTIKKTNKNISKQSQIIGTCPIDNGDIIMTDKYYICSNFATETTTDGNKVVTGCPVFLMKKLKFLAKGSMTQKDIKLMLQKKPSTEKTFISKKGKKFQAQLYFDEQGHTKFKFPQHFVPQPVDLQCPFCHQNLLAGHNDKLSWYYCSQDNLIIYSTSFGHKWTKLELQQLLAGQRLTNIPFIWKSSKKGYGNMHLDSQQHKLVLDFEK